MFTSKIVSKFVFLHSPLSFIETYLSNDLGILHAVQAAFSKLSSEHAKSYLEEKKYLKKTNVSKIM